MKYALMLMVLLVVASCRSYESSGYERDKSVYEETTDTENELTEEEKAKVEAFREAARAFYGE